MTYSRFDAAPYGTLVTRDGCIVYMNDAGLRLMAAERDELLHTSFTDILAPEERDRVADRHRRRLRGEPVPAEYETTTLSRSGARRTVRLSVSIEGADTIVVFHDVTESVARRERLGAIARLGVAIQTQRSDEAVFRMVGDELAAIGLLFCLLRPNAGAALLERFTGPASVLAAVEARMSQKPQGFRGKWLEIYEDAWCLGGSFSDDAVLDIAKFFGGELGDQARLVAHIASLRRAGQVRIDIAGEPTYIITIIGDWLREEDLPALRLFGSQVSAALTAARIIGDLSRRNSELASLNRLAALARTSTDLDSLFGDGLAEIASTLESDGAVVHLIDAERNELRLTHTVGRGDAEVREAFGRVPLNKPDSWLSNVVRTAQPLVFQVATGGADPTQSVLARMGAETLACVPLMSRSAVLGVMNVGFKRHVEIDAERLELLHAMGSHFGAAVESYRLLADLRLRLDELTLVHEVGRALVESLELDEVLDAATRNLARTVDAPDAYIALADAHGEHLVVRSVHGRPAVEGRRFSSQPSTSVASLAFSSQEAVVIEDARTDPRVNQELRAVTGGQAFLGLPLVVRGRGIGAAVVSDTRRPRRFRQAEVERAAAIANQIAVAVENARLYDDLKRSYAALGRAQVQLVERERLAAIGELAAVVAHEVRNPLNVIFNSLGSLRRVAKLEGNARMLLDIVGEEADRLNRIVGDLLDYARPLVLNLERGSLARVLDEVAATALSAGDGGIRLTREVTADLPDVPMDARLLRQALLNIALNAVQAMPHGGTLSLRARSEQVNGGEMALIELGDTGSGIPDHLRQRIFEPFFTTKSTGTGLGLAVVKRIVDSHRGNIAVTSAAGVGTTFSIRLPVEQPSGEGAQRVS